jgi:hypothetical protein
MSQIEPLGSLSSSLTNETTSSHEMALPCASLASATTHLRRLPSNVTVTSGREPMGAAAEDEVPDFPHPGSNTEKVSVAVIEPMPITARRVLGCADALGGIIVLSQ